MNEKTAHLPEYPGTTGDAPLPVTRPYTPDLVSVQDSIAAVLRTGMLTNNSYVRKFEREMAAYLEADDAVAVSNCTTGLIMTMCVLGLTGEVIVPSFTFSATGHACYWAGLTPAFVDCDRHDWTVSISDAMKTIGPRTSAVLAVHTFGNPADVTALEQFAADNDAVLLFDAAHAIGSEYRGRKLGAAGRASVFSLTPTKIITSGEGGVITTNDRSLARELRIFRNYGDDGGYDCQRIGLNGRMSELNAILGIATLKNGEREVRRRNEFAQLYRQLLAGVPGVHFQEIRPRCRSSFKDFTVAIDARRFGATRDDLCDALSRARISTRKYFNPPLHRQSAYRNRKFRTTGLENTDFLSKNALTLPMYSGMGGEAVRRICDSIREFQRNRAKPVEVVLAR